MGKAKWKSSIKTQDQICNLGKRLAFIESIWLYIIVIL